MSARSAALLALSLGIVALPAAAADIHAAMDCIRTTMTSPLVPATAGAEQLANVALARCGDEIERAAIAMAGTPLVHARVDASRIAVRRELHGYAMNVAGGPVSDIASEPAAESRPVW